jgi:hypothetical protein
MNPPTRISYAFGFQKETSPWVGLGETFGCSRRPTSGKAVEAHDTKGLSAPEKTIDSIRITKI